MLDPAKRVANISEQAHSSRKEAKLELVEDEALLAENAGLTEWPVVLMGSFDKAFLEVPGEVLMTSMKTHQKCFSLRDAEDRRSSPTSFCSSQTSSPRTAALRSFPATRRLSARGFRTPSSSGIRT